MITRRFAIAVALALPFTLAARPAHAAVDRNFAAVDPAAAEAADEDFRIQGEYEGKVDDKKAGAQFEALGGGEFKAVHYEGGLPGAGWTPGMKVRTGTAKLVNGVLQILGDEEGRGTGRFEDGVLKIFDSDGKSSAELKKVHRKSETLGARPPAGAVVLFDGSGADRWEGGKNAFTKDKLLNQRAGKSIPTFKSSTVHVEFRTPYMPFKRDQERGNSGVYLEGCYEVQVLDSFGEKASDNQCGGIYSVSAPDLNMSFPPLGWQTYDIDFTAPEFDAAGKKVESARMTVRHNGVLIHKDRVVDHITTAAPFNVESPAGGPLFLQDHGCELRYRNVWVVEKK